MMKIFPQPIKDLGLYITTFLAIKYYSLIYKPLIIRKNTSDYTVFRGIFVLGEFNIQTKVKPKLIIDAGAYTGLSSLYYSSKYPQAKIIAIEPEDSNFEILEKNTANISNISRIKAGLWYKNASLKVLDTNNGKWGFKVMEVRESSPYDVKSVTVDKLLANSGFNEIDILKLDIEGSEKELFTENFESWINKVNVIVIELHDRIRPGCSEAFYSAIDKNKWDEYREVEKVVLVKKSYKHY